MHLFARGLRAVGSFAALLTIIVGLPFALVQWGHWPINGIPTWRQVEELPLTIVTDTALFGVLTVAVWVVWAAFCASVAVELVGNLRGEPGARLPLCGQLQGWARTLVASVVMSVSASGSLGGTPAGGSVSAGPAVVAIEDAPQTLAGSVPKPVVATTRSPEPGRAGPAQPEPAAGQRTMVVRPDDTYWEVAERELGDGLRWREIRDLNIGREMPDGRVITAGSDYLVPGGVLVLPDDEPQTQRRAGRPVDQTVDEPAPEPLEREVHPGDSIWRIAEEHLATAFGQAPADREVANYCRVVIEHNRDRFVELDNPDLIYPGQTFALPPVETGPSPTERPAPGDEAKPSVAEPAPPAADVPVPPTHSPASTPQPAPSPTPTAQDPAREPAVDDADRPVTPIAAITGSALAVGLVAAIRRRRRRRNHLAPKSVPLPTSNEEVHRELIVAADGDAVDSLAVALANLARGLAEADQTGRPMIVQHSAGRTEVLLDRPVTGEVDGWSVVDGSSLLAFDADAAGDEVPRLWTTPTPALVSLGRPDDGQVYLDLEAAGVTTLVGDAVLRLDLLRSFAMEIAHSPLTEMTQVFVVGSLGSEILFEDRDQVAVVDCWDDVIDDLTAWTAESRSALAASGCHNGFLARTDNPDDDALVSLVVLATEPPPSPDALGFLDGAPTTTAIVVAADEALPGSTIVDCAPGEIRLPQLGFSCIPEVLDEERAEQIAALLAEASDPAGTQLALALDVEAESGGNGSDPDDEAGVPHEDPPYKVLVRFLGDVSIEGDLRRRLKPKQVAIVAYIALHSPVPIDRVEDALWAAPTAEPKRKQLSTYVWQCRKVIPGQQLPRAKDGCYSVGSLVKTDLDLFEARVAAASRQQRWEDAADLRLSALSLCTGKVFSTQSADSDSYAWIETSILVSHWEIRITDLAEQVANDCLDHGDARRAIEACEAGLRAMPAHVGCTEALMRAHAHNGNPTALQHVYQTHVMNLELIHLDHPAESTAELYKHLMTTT